jgi:hypothetical protein
MSLLTSILATIDRHQISPKLLPNVLAGKGLLIITCKLRGTVVMNCLTENLRGTIDA